MQRLEVRNATRVPDAVYYLTGEVDDDDGTGEGSFGTIASSTQNCVRQRLNSNQTMIPIQMPATLLVRQWWWWYGCCCCWWWIWLGSAHGQASTLEAFVAQEENFGSLFDNFPFLLENAAAPLSELANAVVGAVSVGGGGIGAILYQKHSNFTGLTLDTTPDKDFGSLFDDSGILRVGTNSATAQPGKTPSTNAGRYDPFLDPRFGSLFDRFPSLTGNVRAGRFSQAPFVALDEPSIFDDPDFGSLFLPFGQVLIGGKCGQFPDGCLLGTLAYNSFWVCPERRIAPNYVPCIPALNCSMNVGLAELPVPFLAPTLPGSQAPRPAQLPKASTFLLESLLSSLH